MSSATGGSYLKARVGEGADATYYKLSCYDEVNGIYGHECVNETIAARLMDVLCIAHVPYRLVHASIRINEQDHETWLSESHSFRARNESKISLARFYALNRLDGESRMDFCARFGWLPFVHKTMLVDYLISNRDRHGGNIEVLKDSSGKLHLAPLFDNGVSLCFSTFTNEQLRSVDPLCDVSSNNFLGTRSLEQNLVEFVPSALPIGRLKPGHKNMVLFGLDAPLEHAVSGITGKSYAEFLWNMIWERWCRYETLRYSGCLKAQS